MGQCAGTGFFADELRATHINTIDAAVVTIANRIINPGGMADMLLFPVRAMEDTEVARNIVLCNNSCLRPFVFALKKMSTGNR